jgi:YidC/Oxa1 family membrane protein insertase
MHDQNNVFYAVALSIFILITWQYFFPTSFLGTPIAPKQPGMIASGTGITGAQRPDIATPAATIPDAQAQPSRQQALARSQRIAIDTPRFKGSIALTGGRIDDLALVQYRETTAPKSNLGNGLDPAGIG